MDVCFKGDLPGTPKDMGPPYGKRDPYYSHIFGDSKMGVGLGNSMGPAYHKGVPCPWGSLKIPLIVCFRLRS